MTRPVNPPAEETHYIFRALWHLGETGSLDLGVPPHRIAQDSPKAEPTVTNHLRRLRENGHVELTTEYSPELGARLRGYRPATPEAETFPPKLRDRP